MHVTKLRLHNWMCYGGEQEIVLAPSVYAITAKKADDSERSNWLGKSSLLNAIAFALYGRHPKERDDDWITEGSKVGEVTLTLSNGAFIRRRREHGKSTRLTYISEPRALGAMQTEAQIAIEKLVGLSETDFLATCYFEQKAMHRFITQKPAERMSTVVGWLRLEPLEKCEADLRAQVSTVLGQVEKVQASIEAQERYIKDTFARTECENVEMLRALHTKASADWQVANGNVREKQRQILNNDAIRSAHRKHAEYESVVKVGKEVAEKHDSKQGDALKQNRDDWSKHANGVLERKAVAERDLRTKLQVVHGGFSGVCPVANIECPATKTINELGEKARADAKEAEALVTKLRAEYGDAASSLSQANQAHEAWSRVEGQLIELRRQAKALAEVAKKKPAEEPVDADLLAIELREAVDAEGNAARQRDTLWTAIDYIEKAQAAITQLGEHKATLTKQLGTAREALTIFGKNGAQKRIAEGALGDIESGANELLVESGIDLSVKVQWSRTADGLANACDACGNPFPSSTKVKTCVRCGAERGPKTVNKLDIGLSNRSGAAEDLAGGAVQLAASSWLRRDRSADWGVAMIDEPFGALDPANRRQFGAHLAAMLRGRYAFEQAFIIAHHPAALDALPSRIEIVSDGKRSQVRVV